VHSTEGHDPAEAAHSQLSRVGPEKMRRVTLRASRNRRLQEVVIHNIEDALDDLEGIKRVMTQALQTLHDIHREGASIEDAFGPEWP